VDDQLNPFSWTARSILATSAEALPEHEAISSGLNKTIDELAV
jgi:hypothetical protein